LTKQKIHHVFGLQLDTLFSHGAVLLYKFETKHEMKTTTILYSFFLNKNEYTFQLYIGRCYMNVLAEIQLYWNECNVFIIKSLLLHCLNLSTVILDTNRNVLLCRSL